MKTINGLKSVDLIVGILICVVAMIFDRLGVLTPSYSALSNIFGSLQQTSSSMFTSVKADWEFIAGIAGIRSRLEVAEKEVEFYKIENERLTKEVGDLSKIVEQQYFDLPYTTLPARVLLYTSGRNVVVINKGEAQNVHSGSAVIINDVFIGRVEKTYQNSSEVRLVSHPELRVPAMLIVDNLRGFVGGDGTGKVQISEIPNINKISISSLVITSGSDSQIPYGLLIGRVDQLTSNQTDLVQSASIEPLIRLNQLSDVFVIIN
jgi:rod shape-determining protein MreC